LITESISLGKTVSPPEPEKYKTHKRLADGLGDAELGQERGEKEGGCGIDSREQK